MSFYREEKGIPLDGGSAALTTAAPGTAAAATITQPSVSNASASTTIVGNQLSTTSRANTVNPLTTRVYTQKYHTLYRKRILLPVFEYRSDFMRLLAENQCIVLVGEVYSCSFS